MIIYVQAICTEWTKKSRGSPGSSLRNSTPELVPVSFDSDKDGELFQLVEFNEDDNFSKPTLGKIKELGNEQDLEKCITIEKNDNGYDVYMVGKPYWQVYPKPKHLGYLKENTWTRATCNTGMLNWSHESIYRKYCFNIFYGNSLKFSEIVTNLKPICEFKDDSYKHGQRN